MNNQYHYQLALDRFDEQINTLRKKLRKDPENNSIKAKLKLSELDRELFVRTANFSIDDWKKIRGKKFWIEHDAIYGEINQKIFLLKKVYDYLGVKY